MIETKNVTIALGVVCVVLAASLIGVLASGLTFSNQQDASDLERQINSLTAQVTDLQNQVNNYEVQIATLTEKINDYENLINLETSVILLDNQEYTLDANTATTLFNDQINAAGYIEVQVESTSDTTYIQVLYTHNDLNYNQTFVVGTDGTAYFPILPGTIEILLGNTNTETTNVTVTLTCIYDGYLYYF